MAAGGASALRVLLVDDEQPSLVVWRTLLAQLRPDAIVDAVTTAEEALAKLRVREYDLLLADHHLPGMSGVELLAIAHRERPHMRRILMTALPRFETALAALQKGRADGFVRKDAGAAEMREQLSAILARD